MFAENATDMSFVHLHVHTEYSIGDAISKIDELFARADGLGMPGLAITDHGTMAGVPEFLHVAESHPNVRPIVGCEFCITEDARSRKRSHIVLIAKNLSGYRNLVKLVSYAHTQGMCHKPRITKEKLTKCREGLICISTCLGSEISQKIVSGKMDEAGKVALWYKQLFGEDFYLEVILHGNAGPLKLAMADDRAAYKRNHRTLLKMQDTANNGIFQLAEELDIKIVATNDVHFVAREDGIAHDVMLAIKAGKKVSDPDRVRYSHLEYLKTEDEMRLLFPAHPEVIENTMEVFSKVECYSIRGGTNMPKISDNPVTELRVKVADGAIRRYGVVSAGQRQRLDTELSIIEAKGVSDYFLMIADACDWVRSNGWMVGPGCGAAAGSLVNYCLGITEVDPMKHGLLFERLFHAGTKALPDIDLDLEPEAQEKIQEYLKEKYGRDCISRITVFGKYGAQGAWTKTAKAMEIPAAQIKRLRSKLSYNWLSLASELWEGGDVWEMYAKASPQFRQAYDIACKLANIIEDTSIHACSMLVSASPLGEIVPVRHQEGRQDGEYTLNCMYEPRWAEYTGALRLDFLSLSILKVIKDALKAIGEHEGIFVEPNDIPLDDAPTIYLYSRGDTGGVFQFESPGVKEYLRKLSMPTFDSITALYALYRPGAMDLIPEFLNANGIAKHAHALAGMAEVCDRTDGMLIYQEQMMAFSQVVAGFTPEESDRLRKAVGKKQVNVLAELKERFIAGGMEVNGLPKRALGLLWHVFVTRGSYLFQQAHAYCYTLVSYWTAWLKAHYPKEFYQALLNNSDDESDRARWIDDAAAHKVHVIPPEKSRSGMYEVLD